MTIYERNAYCAACDKPQCDGSCIEKAYDRVLKTAREFVALANEFVPGEPSAPEHAFSALIDAAVDWRRGYRYEEHAAVIDHLRAQLEAERLAAAAAERLAAEMRDDYVRIREQRNASQGIAGMWQGHYNELFRWLQDRSPDLAVEYLAGENLTPAGERKLEELQTGREPVPLESLLLQGYTDAGREVQWGRDLTAEEKEALTDREILTIVRDGVPQFKLLRDGMGALREKPLP